MSNEPIDLTDIRAFRTQLRVMEREIFGKISDDSCCCGVTMSQCHTLMELCRLENPSLKDLAPVLGLDKSTLSRTIDGMVEQGFVTRTENPENRRSVVIRLTDKGKRVAGSINAYWDEFILSLFSLIPKEKRAQVIESMALIGEALTKAKAVCSCGEPQTCCEDTDARGKV
jgi:DNA-binding MarR family transcriptional regulator